ncbi:MAG TPA: helix-turn-helix domain-containing protein [Polyangiaceae bacterium]|nr:helix-turn-helix domain-containing protein [Polyangiaceae bacterium]
MRPLLDLERFAEVDSGDDHRVRLLHGMATALAQKGYGATTIADVARHARVSKRTFYEHFDDKEACFVACYRAAGEIAIRAILGVLGPKLDWEARVRAATETYLSMLEANPALTRTMMMDIYAAGPRALEVRREVQTRFADLFRQLVDRGRTDHPGMRGLSAPMAAAVIGGINELVLLAVEQGRAHRLTELSGTANSLVRAVLLSLAEAAPRRDRPRPK